MRCRDSLETMKLMRKPARMIQTFNDRYPLVGPAFWISSVQYFITQIVVAHAWTNHYSLSRNTISDLGNTVCGVYSGRFVCSPLHSWMNASFVVLGLALDIPRAFRYYTILSGLIALIALLLFYTHTYLGLGQGGMERLTAHPQTIWLIVFGIYISANHFRRSAKN